MELPPLPKVNSRPPAANRSAMAAAAASSDGASRSRVAACSARADRALAHGRRRRGREQRAGVALVAFDEGIEEVGALAHGASAPTTAIAVPAWTSTRSPGPTGPTSVASTCSTPPAVRTDAAPVASTATTSAGVPSSEQVMHASRRVARRRSPARADRDARSTRA